MFKRFLVATIFMLLCLTGFVASAQAACSVPVTLTNGTTADATQVMTNFTSLAGCAAPSANPSFAGSTTVNGSTGQYAISTISSHAGSGTGYGSILKLTNTAGNTFQQFMSDGGAPPGYYSETGMLTMSTDTGFGIKINTNATDNNGLRIATNGATSCFPSCSNVSDKRIKTDIAALSSAQGLAAIGALRPVSYRWKDPKMGRTPQIGLLAQDVRAVFPQLVTNTGSVTKDAPDGVLALNYSALAAPMVLAIQQLDARTQKIQQQQAEIGALKTAYETQSAELKELRAEVAEVRRSIRIRTAQR